MNRTNYSQDNLPTTRSSAKLQRISKENLELLQQAIECGILGSDSVLDIVMATKRERVKKIHPYAITPPQKEGQRWQTWYRAEGEKRKNIKAYTEEDLLDKLYAIYFPVAHIDKLTFHELYVEWLAYKETVTNSPNTIVRHRQHYAKYFETSVLHRKKIAKIDEIFLETECNRLVKEYKMTKKEWTNVKTILIGMFTYAVRKKYLDENPMSKVKITVKYRQTVRKTGKTETYNTIELEELNKYLERNFTESADTAFLAVKVNFLLGLRVGELVALKWDDICDEQNLHIVREEVKNQVTGQFEVVEHTKTHQDRFVAIVPKAYAIFERIPRTGEYIFERNGTRITARQIAYILEKFATQNGVPTKSTHKMRKTYASNLNANGVPIDSIRQMLGHSSLNTTLAYIYDPLTSDETYNLIVNAL